MLATLFALPLDDGCRLTLCDDHAEMLDLFDRLARAFAGVAGTQISIVATAELDEAMEDANTVILSMDPICEDRAETLQSMFREINDEIAKLENLLVFNLVTPTDVSGRLLNANAFHLDWPVAPPAELAYMAAHRALRWVRADVPAFEPLQEYKETPLSRAMLDARPAPEYRYDPTGARNTAE